jgi:hypothetical protein
MDQPADRMTHDEFVTAFESCTLPGDWFRHKEHVRLAWLYLRRLPYSEAVAAIERSVRAFAMHHGAAGKYHHTITLVWMRLVAAAIAQDGDDDFAAFIARHPELLNKHTLQLFYSAARLESPVARASWLEPDLKPLPAH